MGNSANKESIESSKQYPGKIQSSQSAVEISLTASQKSNGDQRLYSRKQNSVTDSLGKRSNSYNYGSFKRSASLYELKKTTQTNWPIPSTELFFLSHFKINHNGLKEYINQEYLAKGAFGRVYKVTDKRDTSNYTLKVLNKAQIIENNGIKQCKDEVDIQTICGHHPYIVDCLSCWQDRHKLYLLLEYIPCGELFDTIKLFTYELVQIYVAQLAFALDFLQNAGIIYRDLKPENILLDNNYNIKLIDFGLSKWLKYGYRTNTLCGTFDYMAPEILYGQPYGHACDWYSLGVIASRMLTGQFPVVKRDECGVNKDEPDCKVIQENVQKIGMGSPEIILPSKLQELDTKCRDLLIRLLNSDPKQRLHTFLALERIPMFKDFNFTAIREKTLNPTPRIIYESNVLELK